MNNVSRITVRLKDGTEIVANNPRHDFEHGNYCDIIWDESGKTNKLQFNMDELVFKKYEYNE